MEPLQDLFTDFDKSSPNFNYFGLGEGSEFLMVIAAGILFGLALRGLYHLYFGADEAQDSSIARSLLLITPAFASVFFLVKTNVALSFGLLGSLAFVRYRTPVKRGEDIAFIIFAIAAALSAATFNYLVGVVLCLLLLIYAYLKKYVMERGFSGAAVVTFNTKKQIPASEVLSRLGEVNSKTRFLSSRTYDGITSMVFRTAIDSKKCHDIVTEKLTELDHEAHLSIFYPSERLGL